MFIRYMLTYVYMNPILDGYILHEVPRKIRAICWRAVAHGQAAESMLQVPEAPRQSQTCGHGDDPEHLPSDHD